MSSDTTHVERPQNGAKSHDLPGSTVAHFVLAKHIPGKSIERWNEKKNNEIKSEENFDAKSFEKFKTPSES